MKHELWKDEEEGLIFLFNDKDNFEKVRSFQEEYGPRLLTLIKNDDEEENDE